jgi:hypothetical protein
VGLWRGVRCSMGRKAVEGRKATSPIGPVEVCGGQSTSFLRQTCWR